MRYTPYRYFESLSSYKLLRKIIVTDPLSHTLSTHILIYENFLNFSKKKDEKKKRKKIYLVPISMVTIYAYKYVGKIIILLEIY